MAIADDFSVAANGDIRYTGSATNYTVIELHRWLGDLMDDAQASGNDLLDITDATASQRATDNLITLNAPFNIDDTAAQHLYDGSIVQDNGDTIYDGLVIIAAQGMYLDIIQDGAVLTPNFWTTGYNADATAGYSHRFMVKVRTGGADIDGRRLLGITREFGFTYSEFPIAAGTSRGNNVMALTYATDLNNQTDSGTVSGYSTITNSTDGYVLLDVDGNLTPEAYYSEWDKDIYTINDFYEYIKYLTRRGTSTTLYGINGELLRGITSECDISTGSGTWGTPEHEEITWTGGSGRLLAVDNKTGSSTTKIWFQLLTGQNPTTGQVVSGTTSLATATTTGSATSRTISQPWCGVSTGSAIIGSYGFGIETTDLTNQDKLFDLTNTQRIPPNQVQFTVSGLSTATGGDRILVGPLGYYFEYYNESSGPFTLGETLTFGGGGTAYLSELLDQGDTGFIKVRMLTGSPPAADESISGGGSGATANVFADAVVSEDPRQLKLNTTLSATNEVAVVCTASIPTDTPTTGSIRIQLDSGIFRRVDYTGYSSATFTIAETDFSSDNATGGAGETGNSLFISYIDKNATSSGESFTSVYSANRNLFIRVRFGDPSGPIKTFETSGTLTSSGGSATAIRTVDT